MNNLQNVIASFSGNFLAFEPSLSGSRQVETELLCLFTSFPSISFPFIKDRETEITSSFPVASLLSLHVTTFKSETSIGSMIRPTSFDKLLSMELRSKSIRGFSAILNPNPSLTASLFLLLPSVVSPAKEQSASQFDIDFTRSTTTDLIPSLSA